MAAEAEPAHGELAEVGHALRVQIGDAHTGQGFLGQTAADGGIRDLPPSGDQRSATEAHLMSGNRTVSDAPVRGPRIGGLEVDRPLEPVGAGAELDRHRFARALHLPHPLPRPLEGR